MSTLIETLLAELERPEHKQVRTLVKARLETKSGKIAAARTDLHRIRELNPFAPLPS